MIVVPNRPPGAIDPARPVSHFTALGIPISDLTSESEVLNQVIADVYQTGGWHRSPDGQLTSCAWVDASGARLDLLITQEHQVVCATPQLEGCRGSQVVRILAVVDKRPTGGCPGCAVVEAEILLANGRVRPITFAPAGIAPHRESFEAAAAQLATVQVGMVLVAEAASCRGRPDSTMKTTLHQVSELADVCSRATVRASVRVTAVAERETSLKRRFWSLQVECLGHCFDLVADPAVLPSVREGDVLNVTAWVCGLAWW
ncbi:hypothetical protein [Flindersiella endophytica]